MATEKLHYEDFPEGLVIPFGTHHLTREEVIAFATEWDPQDFHVDEGGGAKLRARRIGGIGLADQRAAGEACC